MKIRRVSRLLDWSRLHSPPLIWRGNYIYHVSFLNSVPSLIYTWTTTSVVWAAGQVNSELIHIYIYSCMHIKTK